jgi:chromosome segregation ATPase
LMVLQAAAAAAQHSQTVSSLEAQLSTLQRQHKQLQGKSAQQARDLREATDAGKAARFQQQAVQGELQALKKQLQGKAAALSRQVSVSPHGVTHHGDCVTARPLYRVWQVRARQHSAFFNAVVQQVTPCMLWKYFDEVPSLGSHVWLCPAGAHL